ncbi:TetR/AcrR family transcriptional regulator [Desulfobacter curvatus]|uniref:TetR/AcrR family transcriptional regulator n=1 Tax=Desulfobacter curvatus TaxID=2290 RepID=UPI000370EA5D|nr:TetR/AcrR family transcriptional regulator [Desulfobacter curvatus]
MKKNKNTGIRRRRLTPEARRIELLEAAVQVLNTIGPANARVEDITKTAGTAKGTFYLYFSSWEDMLEAVRKRILSTYVTEMKNRFVCQTPADWWAAFENECMAFIRFRENLGELHEAIFHGAIAERPVHSTLSTGAIVGWMLKEGIRIGACRNIDVEVAAELVFSVMHTMGDNIMLTGERDRYIQTTFELFRFWLGRKL